jgi:magnesium transporter
MQVNRVIKVLTVLATLSMPIVVITSYYGMNFRNFGELDIRFPHLWVFGLSALLTSCVYIFLRKKRWL